MTGQQPMSPTLFVYSQSDTFREFWGVLAAAAEMDLEVGVDLSLAASSPLLIISCAGAEDRAAELVREAGAVSAATILVVGAEADHRLAAQVVRAGAHDYFALPAEAELLRDDVHARAEAARSSAARAELIAHERHDYDFSQIVCASRTMQEALDRAARIIPRGSSTVLITGETGTGKELLARAIHYNGPRAEGPFVEINCSAIPSNLLESELFGHEKGAFTDARRAKPGLFEVANAGTVFLDEIGEMPFELQGKLLKAVEDKRIRRVGGTRSQTVDVRIIAATNVDIAAEVRAGSFREDLYYRLSVIPIRLPPLRERGDDILLLTDHFIDALSRDHDLPRPDVSPAVRDRLLAYSWPGNVRELRNAIERALLLGSGRELDPADLFLEASAAPESPGRGPLPFPATLEAIELAAVKEMLEATGGNKSAAARRLGISRSRLHRALNRIAELGGG